MSQDDSIPSLRGNDKTSKTITSQKGDQSTRVDVKRGSRAAVRWTCQNGAPRGVEANDEFEEFLPTRVGSTTGQHTLLRLIGALRRA